MITAEVALYPSKAENSSEVINKSISVLKNTDIKFTTDSMKTHITGNEEEVFQSLNSMFAEAQRNGCEINMVITVTNCAD